MKIVIIGGTGLIGTKTAAILRAKGHDVNAAAPSTSVNTLTGEGVDKALAGADVVIDLSNSPSFEDQAVLDFFRTSGTNLIAAERKAGIRHHVLLSIVGTDRMPDNGYFRAKVAQEEIIRGSGIPFTIIRSTQFMEFIGGIADAGVMGGEIHLSPGLFQPIAADDVATFVADIAMGAPQNGAVEIAGPLRAPLSDIAQMYLAAIGDKRRVVADKDAHYFGGYVEEKSLVPLGEARIGAISLDGWLGAQKKRA